MYRAAVFPKTVSRVWLRRPPGGGALATGVRRRSARRHSAEAGADGDVVVFDDARAGAGAGAVDAGLEVGLGGLYGLPVAPRLAVGEGLLSAVEPDFDEAGARALGELHPGDQVILAVGREFRAFPEGGRAVPC